LNSSDRFARRNEEIQEEMMRTLLLAFTASAGLIGAIQAQTNQPSSAPTNHAVSPESGKAKSTPDTTQIPGSSTTGNATGPGGTTSAAAPTLPQGPSNNMQGSQSGSTKGVVPSPRQ
jgi:hypothetical protein